MIVSGQAVTPKFVPAGQRAPSGVVPAMATGPLEPLTPVALQQPPVSRPKTNPEESVEAFVRTELPGPQRLFMRDSEAQFFERIAQDVRKQPGGGRAIFPEEPIISKEPFRPRQFPTMVELVEPSYVCHRRLYFEQPNFERIGYNFGVLQPAICLGVFYYDLALLPYHAWSDLHDRSECNVGKCLPRDQAPLLVPREKFSITGLVGQTGAVVGGLFLFP